MLKVGFGFSLSVKVEERFICWRLVSIEFRNRIFLGVLGKFDWLEEKMEGGGWSFVCGNLLVSFKFKLRFLF